MIEGLRRFRILPRVRVGTRMDLLSWWEEQRGVEEAEGVRRIKGSDWAWASWPYAVC